jgi:autotransporter strand-loop-strand O-heptosyltransferase
MMPEELAKLFSPQYPDIKFETPETARQLRPYATYYLGLFFKGDTDWQPYDFRLCSLSETAGRILGNDDLSEIPPRLSIGGTSIPADPYVCIATQASNHAKHWNCPGGWRRVIKVLTSSGYRVLCIDKDAESGHGDVWHEIPHGCEDFTGNRPLQERADLIRHAKCFIGLSSGLSWLAWSCGTPIVLISGICMPFGEFQTPYRVQTRHTCHGCWNDTRYEFDHSDYMWCPVLKGTDRAFECTRAISPAMVLYAISKVPGMELKTRQV